MSLIQICLPQFGWVLKCIKGWAVEDLKVKTKLQYSPRYLLISRTAYAMRSAQLSVANCFSSAY